MRSAHPRRTWFSIHRWLGIGPGAWFALLGLTGSLPVFEDALDAWLNPDLLSTRSRGTALAPDAIAARAAAEFPQARVERMRLPAASGDVYRLFVRASPQRRVGHERIEATFDPVTGALLGTCGADALGLAPRHLLKTLYEFHRNVLLGNTGSNLVVALLLLATMTGGTLVRLNYVRDRVGVFSKIKSFPTVPPRGGPRRRLSLLPAPRRRRTRARRHDPAGASAVARDPARAQRRHAHRRRDADALVPAAAYRHCVGTGGRIAMCATASAPLLLVGTGLWVWLRKRRGERIGCDRRAARLHAPAAPR
jgi:uncharacterized iron-regulated membrane protein